MSEVEGEKETEGVEGEVPEEENRGAEENRDQRRVETRAHQTRGRCCLQ